MLPPVRKRFPRNPYTVNIMEVWECGLVDVQVLSKDNDTIKNLLSVIDVFSKYLHVVPPKSKTGTSVTAAFHSGLKTADTRNPYSGDRSGCRRIGERNSQTNRLRIC